MYKNSFIYNTHDLVGGERIDRLARRRLGHVNEVYNRDDLRDIRCDGKRRELPRDREFWQKGSFKTPGDPEEPTVVKSEAPTEPEPYNIF